MRLAARYTRRQGDAPRQLAYYACRCIKAGSVYDGRCFSTVIFAFGAGHGRDWWDGIIIDEISLFAWPRHAPHFEAITSLAWEYWAPTAYWAAYMPFATWWGSPFKFHDVDDGHYWAGRLPFQGRRRCWELRELYAKLHASTRAINFISHFWPTYCWPRQPVWRHAFTGLSRRLSWYFRAYAYLLLRWWELCQRLHAYEIARGRRARHSPTTRNWTRQLL